MARLPIAQRVRLDALIAEHCTPEWQEFLVERNTRLTFKKGEHIFSHGQAATHMYMIHRGRVKITARQAQGRERIIRLAGDGEVMGHRAIGDQPIYAASAIALSETRVNAVPMALFLSSLKGNGPLCYHFLLYFAAEMRAYDQDMRDLLVMNVRQRVAKTLLLALETFGLDETDKRKLAFTLSRKDIASMAGTTYESVIRTLADLQRSGIIQLVGKEVRILKKRELEQVMHRSPN
jgi:CRP/FNR family transcriptional regulator